MNREIKFRGHTGSEWVFGFYLQNDDGTDMIQDETGMVYEVNNAGQYTELKDKNEVLNQDRLLESHHLHLYNQE